VRGGRWGGVCEGKREREGLRGVEERGY